MVNERDDKYESQEESEYHFSDDQAVYEIEGESKTPPVTNQGTILNKISQYRRPIIGIVVFLILITVIYVMLAPSATQIPTEIGQNVPPPKKVAKPVVTVKTVTQQQAVQLPAPQQPPAPQAVVSPIAVAPATPLPPQPVPQYLPTPQVQQASLPPVMPTPVVAASTPTTLPPPMAATPASQPPVVIQTGAAPSASVPDRVTALEDQNTKLMTLMQTEYLQKLSEYQEQNNQMREQLQTMNSRMVDIEKNLNRLLQALGGNSSNNNGRSNPEYGAPPARRAVAEVKIAYTVQAIIPGRAWLKSESGETITVAEGDKLKGIGNIIKIDPYDGVVDIDTGSRVVTLSYGN